MSIDRGRYIAILVSGLILIGFMLGPVVSISSAENTSFPGSIDRLSEGPWPSFGCDESNTRLSDHDTSHVDGTVKWQANTGAWVWSSPAVGSENIMYIGSPDNKLYAFNVEDGSKEWTYTTNGDILSSPAVSIDETIYFGSGDNNIYAVNHGGTLEWKYETNGEVYSSPTVDLAGTVYVGSYDGNLYAVNADGSLKWKFSSNSWLWSSPSISDDGVVYVGSGDDNLYAIDKEDGTELWRYHTEGDIYSSPATADDGTVYFGSYDGYLYALNPDGSLKWKFDAQSKVRSSPAIGPDGTVYFGTKDGEIYAVKDGDPVWNVETDGWVRSSPAIGADGTIYIGSDDGNVYALDETGDVNWKYDTGDDVYSSPAIGSDGTVYVGSWNSNVYAFTGNRRDENTGEMDIWKEVEMTMRIAGRKDNSVKAVVAENGENVSEIEVTREPGKPQKVSEVLKYRKGSEYDLKLIYDGDIGANPVWLTFRANFRFRGIFKVFVNYYGDHQEVNYDLDDKIGGMMEKVKEIHFSADGFGDDIVSYEWQFGDGYSASGKTVEHIYQKPGDYTVTLTAVDDQGEITVIEEGVEIDGCWCIIFGETERGHDIQSRPAVNYL